MAEPSQGPTIYYLHRIVETPEEEGEEYMGTVVTPQGVINLVIVKMCVCNEQGQNVQVGAQGGVHY